jgi:hypothetical protein
LTEEILASAQCQDLGVGGRGERAGMKTVGLIEPGFFSGEEGWQAAAG